MSDRNATEPRRFRDLNDEAGNPVCYCGKGRPAHWATCGGVVCRTTGQSIREAEAAQGAAPRVDVEAVMRDIRAHFMEGLSDHEYDAIRSLILARIEYARLRPADGRQP